MKRLPKRAFTIVELMVALSVLVILASVTAIYFGSTRRNSRDARRKADVQTITSAVSQYTVVSGTTFIHASGLTCTLPDEKNPANVPNFATNPGCVGASGRGYGKMNLKNATSSGYATNAGRAYAPMSIGESLVNDRYLTKMPQDPNAGSNSFTDPDAPDYVLIRACIVSGIQEVGTRGTVFGVWTPLENVPTDQEEANSDRYPGGKLAGPVGGGGTYVFDFAAQQTEWQSGAFYFNGFAAGNGITKVVGAAPCATVGPKPA